MSALTKGVHHVGLTVRDLAESRSFFVDVLGFEVLGGRPSYPACYVTDGTTMITLWQASEPSEAAAFDRHAAIGLHHLCFAVDRAGLESILGAAKQLPACEIEFEPQLTSSGTLRHMMIAIPGSGIRVELRETT